MKLYYPITVDLYNLYPLKKMDAQQYNIGRGALVTLTAAGQVIAPDNEMVTLWAKKPDNTVSYLPCTVVNGQIKADFTNQMLALAGSIQVELRMIKGQDNITTPIFTVEVHPSNIDDDAVESQNEFSALIQALQEVADLKENGLKGDPGRAATIKVGTVTASEPGGEPTVTNSGTIEDAVFDFVIPRGETGPTGPMGPQEVFFGAFAEFPEIGVPDMLYVDTSVDPRLLYNWDSVTSKYILAGGTGGEGGSSIDIPIILPSNDWTGEASPYAQSLTVPQMREGMTPILFLAENADPNMLYAYGLIVDYAASYGQITFYAADLPSVDISIVLKGLPAQQLEYVDNTVIVLVSASGFELNEDYGRYTQTIAVDGMTAGLGGNWDIVRSGPVLTLEESDIVRNITDINRLDGAVEIVCLTPPEQDYMLYFQGTQTPVNDDTPILAGMQGWFGRVEQLEDNQGDKFSATKAYTIGDYCIYEDVLFKFIADKEAGEWDETTVERTKLTTEIQSSNSKIEFGIATIDMSTTGTKNQTIAFGPFAAAPIAILAMFQQRTGENAIISVSNITASDFIVRAKCVQAGGKTDPFAWIALW